jgi:N-methylhydantoinase A
VTDANLLLGYLDASRPYGGSIRLDRDRAAAALAPLAERFGLSLLEAAHGVVEVANANMLRALRLVSVQRGYDLRHFALVAYGGAGPVHAGALAGMAGVARVVVPAHSGAFSALGCLVSPLRYDAVVTYRAPLAALDGKPLDDRFQELEARCVVPLAAEGIALDRVSVVRSVDLRYAGQNYELEIPYAADPAALRARFEARHRQLYGYATGDDVECVNARVVATVPAAAEDAVEAAVDAAGESRTGERRAFFPRTGEVTVARHRRHALAPGRWIAGPAVIEDEWSTTVVYPGQRCAAGPAGDLTIETPA